MFPDCFSKIGIDRGAIRFVLSGAALMAPGLTSKGGTLPSDGEKELGEGDVVVVQAEGKEEVCHVHLLNNYTGRRSNGSLCWRNFRTSRNVL